MPLDRADREEQLAGDLVVAAALADQAQDLDLPGGQAQVGAAAGAGVDLGQEPLGPPDLGGGPQETAGQLQFGGGRLQRRPGHREPVPGLLEGAQGRLVVAAGGGGG